MPPPPDVHSDFSAAVFSPDKLAAIVFSDLDGTLLDAQTYRFDAALQALEVLRLREIPLVLCSSKTRREIEVYRERLGNGDPFIFENGGGICIPEGLFPFDVDGELTDGCHMIPLGAPYELLRDTLGAIRGDLGVAVTGFGDLTAAGVAELTGLPLAEADLARRREFDEPFVFDDPNNLRTTDFLRAIEARGLRWTRGRFFHILGDNDKGRAARVLTEYYRRGQQALTTVGIGDSLNDLPLLEAVDIPVLVQREDGSHLDGVRSPRLVLADGVGPVGWNRAILGMFGR